MEYTKISRNDFYQKLSSIELDDESIVFEGIEIDENVVISDKVFKGESIYLRNCKFNSALTFNGATKLVNIYIESCEFGSLIVAKTTIKINESDPRSGCIIINSSKLHLLQIRDSKIERDLEIIRNCEIKYADFGKTSFKGHLILQDATVVNDFRMMECDVTNELKFMSSDFKQNTSISKSTLGYLYFYKSIHRNFITIIASTIAQSLNFVLAEIESGILIQDINTPSKQDETNPTLLFRSSTFKMGCDVKYTQGENSHPFQFIQIDNTRFDNTLYIRGSENLSNKNQINKISIDFSRRLSGDMIFSDLQIGNAELRGINFNSSITFNDIVFCDVMFKNFTNKGSLQLIGSSSNSENRSKLTIENSYLDKAHFSNSNLASFKSYSIKNSDFSQVSSSNVEWFEYKQIHTQGATKEGFSQNREIFRQLKFAMEKQGNKIQSLIFKQYEMKAYWEELRLTKSKFWEKCLLWVSKSNEYGQNWIRPILLIAGFTIVFYFPLLIIQSNSIGFRPAESKTELVSTLHIFWSNKKILPQLIYPAHNLETLFGSKENLSGWTYCLDYLYKIILSYLIFQAIAAFRKYVK